MEPNTGARRASVAGLAIVGFIALVVLGLWLALYLARSLSGKDGLGAVGDYLDSMFSSGSSSTLAVVPDNSASTTISFGESSTTSYGQSGYTYAASTTTASTTKTYTASTTTKKTTKTYTAPPTYYRTVTTTYPVAGATRTTVSAASRTHTYYGLPDLSVNVVSVGYIDSNGTFVATTSMPLDSKFAAKILVINNGTNETGRWDITVTMPTNVDSSFFHTETMPTLLSGDATTIDMTLDVGHPRHGTTDISVTLDHENKITESNEGNNTDSHTIIAY